MRNIDAIEPNKFGCFYFSPLSGDVSVYLLSPDGDIEFTDYEAFSCDNGTVVAFDKFNPQSTDYAYKLVCGDEEEIVQFQTYENLVGILENTDARENSFFALFGSKSVVSRAESGEHLFVPLEEHCDKHIYGAAPFFELQDGINETIIDFSKFTFSNIKSVFPVLAIQGEACIMRIEFNEEDGSYRNYPAVTAIAKTLTGIIRTCCEWRMMTSEPFNNTEFPAIKVTNFINQLGVDAEIENAVRSAQEPMHVERFITDPQNCRSVIEETGFVPEELKELVKRKVRYLTLSSLSANTAFNATENLLIEEKSSIESAIYRFAVYNNISIDSLESSNDLAERLTTATVSNCPSNALGIYEYLEKFDSL
jgi:hypothetical protein